MCKDKESQRDYESTGQQVFQFIIHNAQLNVYHIKKENPRKDSQVFRFCDFKVLSNDTLS